MTWVLLVIATVLATPSWAQSQRGLSLSVPSTQDTLLPSPPRPPPVPPARGLQPAPLPNRDIDGPVMPRASNDPSLAPSLFTRSDTYRGDGFGKGSTAAIEQERRVKPGAGFNLRVPFAPN